MARGPRATTNRDSKDRDAECLRARATWRARNRRATCWHLARARARRDLHRAVGEGEPHARRADVLVVERAVRVVRRVRARHDLHDARRVDVALAATAGRAARGASERAIARAPVAVVV